MPSELNVLVISCAPLPAQLSQDGVCVDEDMEDSSQLLDSLDLSLPEHQQQPVTQKLAAAPVRTTDVAILTHSPSQSVTGQPRESSQPHKVAIVPESAVSQRSKPQLHQLQPVSHKPRHVLAS